MTSNYDAVVFDLGNVLIEWDRRNLYGQLISDPAELDHFLDNVLTMDDNAKLDSGTPIDVVAADVAARHPDYHDLAMVYADRWKETLGSVIEGSVEILNELKATGITLLALSNWGKDTFASIEADYPFLELFDGKVISGREGVVKPGREIFDILCERYEVAASKAVFIDDSVANIESATALGFDALLFEDSATLREQLRSRSMLP